MTDERQDILALSPGSLARWLTRQGEPAYRPNQVLEWICRRYADSFQAMSNLSQRLRQRLAAAYSISPLAEGGRAQSRDGRTEKFLFNLRDGEQVESVAMSAQGRLTFCVSVQAGCALGCRFCATGAMGFGRNLTTAEILGQVTALAHAKGGLRNLVFMGMGEPLLNLGAVAPALEALTDPRRFALGARRITLSTAGVTPGIHWLAASSIHPNLALSLNSPFSAQRSELMPVNRKYPLAEVIEACRRYAERSGRQILLEYVVIHGVNSSVAAARAVAGIARGLGALVNLIAYNPVPEREFESPSTEEMRGFKAVLEKESVEVTERFRRGREIAAGCGQLRGRHASEPVSTADAAPDAPAPPPRRALKGERRAG
jgi:23S rRNA (adenine2503-C2)-methyltransferase